MQLPLRILLIVILICTPAFADSRSHLSQDVNINQARRLIQQTRFIDALTILRPHNDSSRADITDIRFLIGLAAIGAAQQTTARQTKHDLLDEAVAAFHAILLNQPELVRVRLELARAFFIKGDDELAKENFERVLGGNPPTAMAVNIRRFLQAIRARKRWSGYFSVNVEQNNNINSGTDKEEIYLFGLPFRVNEESRPRAERGLVFAGGGEYQYPLSEQWRWRFGGDAVRSEYRGHELDQTYLSFRTGPRWLISRRGEASLQTFGGQRWAATKRLNQEFGLRFNARHQINRKLGVNGRWSLKETHPRDEADGQVVEVDYSVGGNYLFSPLLQGNIGIGGGESRPHRGERSHKRNVNIGFGVVLPKGWTVGGNAAWSRTRYKRNAPFSPERQISRGRTYRLFLLNRGLTLFNFSPQISVARELQQSNSTFDNYQRTRWNINFIRQF